MATAGIADTLGQLVVIGEHRGASWRIGDKLGQLGLQPLVGILLLEKLGDSLSAENEIDETDVGDLDEKVGNPIAESPTPHEVHHDLWASEKGCLQRSSTRSDDGHLGETEKLVSLAKQDLYVVAGEELIVIGGFERGCAGNDKLMVGELAGKPHHLGEIVLKLGNAAAREEGDDGLWGETATGAEIRLGLVGMGALGDGIHDGIAAIEDIGEIAALEISWLERHDGIEPIDADAHLLDAVLL